jgi:nicotinate-nucleotide pyrophosphorylase (carboxylating)
MEGSLAVSPDLRWRLTQALKEDLGGVGDITSMALVPWDRQAKGSVLAKASGRLCGLVLWAPLAEAAVVVFKEGEVNGARPLAERIPPLVAQSVNIRIMKEEGGEVEKGEVVAEVSGPAWLVLAIERTALNFISHLSGIATRTAEYVRLCEGTVAHVLDTRKTMPLWRDLQKYAVRCGGGQNHRTNLSEMILIKDNHLALWGARDPAGAVRKAREAFPGRAVEVEVVDLEQLEAVFRGSDPEMVLVDNFSPGQVAEAVGCRDRFFQGRTRFPLIEASGGISLASIRAFALAGADRISCGALTHSVLPLDFSLEL